MARSSNVIDGHLPHDTTGTWSLNILDSKNSLKALRLHLLHLLRFAKKVEKELYRSDHSSGSHPAIEAKHTKKILRKDMIEV